MKAQPRVALILLSIHFPVVYLILDWAGKNHKYGLSIYLSDSDSP